MQSSVLPQLLLAGDFILAPGSEVGPRTMDEFEIIYFINPKSLHYTMGQDSFVIDQPCIVVQHAGVRQNYKLEGCHGVRHQFIHFHPGSMLESMLSNWPHKGLFSVADDSVTVDLFNELLHVSSIKDYGWLERCSAMLFVIMTRLFAEKTEPDVTKLPIEIQSALYYIEGHLEEQIGVKHLAEAAKWSHEHFTRVFKSHVGMSTNQYILTRRIEMACKHIAYTTLSIKEIAEKTGFQSEHYFSRTFKRLKTVTPSQYRKKVREYRISEVQDTVWKSQHPLNTYFFLTI